MRVKVLLFARLRDIAGGELVRDIAPATTVSALWRDLAIEFPGLAPYQRAVSAAVNEDYAAMDRILQEGDEVAFLPPVSGG